MSKGVLTVISGPSGAGKGTVIRELLRDNSAELSVSCTTREPRDGEIDGVSYFFKTKDEFKTMIYNGDFLEYAQVFGNYYGTPKEYVKKKLHDGKNVILEIDVQGAMKVKENCPEAVMIFILPPSMKELYRRLAGRATETKEAVKKRFGIAKSEIAYAKKYDYVIVNDTYEQTALNIKKVMEVSRFSAVCTDKIDELLNEEGVEK